MTEGWRGAFIVLTICAALLLALGLCLRAGLQIGDHKRALMRDCLSQHEPSRSPADCHNGIYGNSR